MAHVPLAALVLVCELAGNYDLLVPLMLALAVAFVALRCGRSGSRIASLAAARTRPSRRPPRPVPRDRSGTSWAVAADLMTAPVTVTPADHLRRAAERLVNNGLRELPVIDSDGGIVGFIDEAEIARVYLRAAARAEEAADSSARLQRAGSVPGIADRSKDPGP